MRRFEARRKQVKRDKTNGLGRLLILIGILISLYSLRESHTTLTIFILIGISSIFESIGCLLIKYIKSLNKLYSLEKWLNQ